MRVVLAGVGSRGDYQPLLALGVALNARGHRVSMYGARNFAEWTAREGLAFTGSNTDVDELLESAADSLSKPLQTFVNAQRIMRDELDWQFPRLVALAKNSDLVIGSGLCMAGLSAAELAGVPFHMAICSSQLVPSREHPPFQVPFQHLPPWVNGVAHRATQMAMHFAFGRRLVALRRELGLSPKRDLFELFVGDEVLIACDREIAPTPADGSLRCVELGSFQYRSSAPLPAHVEAWLATGAAPLYVGFGSMPDPQPAATHNMLERITRELGVRAILCQPVASAQSETVSERVCVVGSVAHAALLPRVALAIHHGGAGTSAAAARAGVPQIIVPHLFDQYYFAERLRRCGVAPAPLPRRSLDERLLKEAIREVLTQPTFAAAARRLGSALAQRDGVANAVEYLESRYEPHVVRGGLSKPRESSRHAAAVKLAAAHAAD